jgi:hypothetical protein
MSVTLATFSGSIQPSVLTVHLQLPLSRQAHVSGDMFCCGELVLLSSARPSARPAFCSSWPARRSARRARSGAGSSRGRLREATMRAIDRASML